ncbi:hypothetical protein JXM83_04755 [Candidatus Woesearchaeota archaeon]|nr:hypothetical protein [Candidatus Woesearchaeota archaeon]
MQKVIVKLFVFFVLLFSSSQIVFSCISPLDCQQPKCTGSIPLCIDSECKYSDCLLNTVSRSEDLPDNSYYKYAYDIIDNMNLSTYGVKTESGMYESVLSWVKFHQTVMFMILTLASIIIAIVLVLLWQLIKSNALLKIIALLLIVLLAALFAITFIVNPDIFTRLSQGDFSALSFSNIESLSRIEDKSRNKILESKQLSQEYIKALDGNLEYAKEIRLLESNGQVSVLYLNFKSEDGALSYLDNKVQATTKTRQILGRLAYVYELQGKTGVYTYRIQDGDVVYFITGDEESIEGVANRIFVEDVTNVEKRIEIEFDNLNCQNNNLVSFKIYDSSELIALNNYSINVLGTSGFKKEFCYEASYGYNCKFNSTLKIGKNLLTVIVFSETSSGIRTIVEKENEITFDNIKPQVIFELTNKNNNLVLVYSDTGVGINIENTLVYFNGKKLDCSCEKNSLKFNCVPIEFVPIEGDNLIETIVKDNCDNELISHKKFVVDTIPPIVSSINDYPKIIEISDVSGIARLFIDSEEYDLNQCLIINGVYTCTIYDSNRTTKMDIVVEDLVGNKIRKLI